MRTQIGRGIGRLAPSPALVVDESLPGPDALTRETASPTSLEAPNPGSFFQLWEAPPPLEKCPDHTEFLSIGRNSVQPRDFHRTSSARRTDSPSARSRAEEESWHMERHARWWLSRPCWFPARRFGLSTRRQRCRSSCINITSWSSEGSIGRLNGLNLLIDTGTIPSMVDTRIARKLRLHDRVIHARCVRPAGADPERDRGRIPHRLAAVGPRSRRRGRFVVSGRRPD